jgi:hypothetical protein
VIEALMLKALALQTGGSAAEALETLQQALASSRTGRLYSPFRQ